MSISAKMRRAPARLATGAFILNSGVGKLGADEETAKAMHGLASQAYPVLEKIEPKVFVKALAIGEIGLGGALLAPIVPAAVAGAGLAAFSGGLLGMYWRTPRMHRPNDPRPTPDGVALAKDVWMAGIAASLIADAVGSVLHDRGLALTHRARETTAVGAVKATAHVSAAKNAAKHAAQDAARHTAIGASKRAHSARSRAAQLVSR